MRCPWILLPFLFLLGLPSTAFGQVNTERMRALDVEGVRTTLGSSVNLQSGNVDLFEVGVQARIDYRRAEHYAFLAGDLLLCQV